METRSTEQSEHRLAKRIRTAALIIVVGALAAVWYPLSHSAAAAYAVDDAPVALAMPGMPVYFPARFAIPALDEPRAPTF